MERDRDHRGAHDARPHPLTGEHPAQIQSIANHGVSQREKRHDDIGTARELEIQVWKEEFLGDGVLCKHGRNQYSDRSKIHTRTRKASPSRR